MRNIVTTIETISFNNIIAFPFVLFGGS